ncbi:hypothetical protein [Nonomuraea sp. SYSU D8015]|uniref:hypothetical protein n=1 Tax=Nonomuraea sp. SYSU D8015 TaxID=2593644 RepID=UPI0016617572|nr:hypothetical protein [Nonomuraea sp. SYSU D8015]
MNTNRTPVRPGKVPRWDENLSVELGPAQTVEHTGGRQWLVYVDDVEIGLAEENMTRYGAGPWLQEGWRFKPAFPMDPLRTRRKYSSRAAAIGRLVNAWIDAGRPLPEGGDA